MKFKATKREILGKKVKLLRKEGLVPGTVYGPKKKPFNVTVNSAEILKLFKKVGYSKFFDLDVEGDKSYKVLVKDIEIHPLKDIPLSVSFYRVDEDRKINVEVPINLIGESPAVKQNLGFLIQQMEDVILHCYPKDLPESIEIDISNLLNTGDSISVDTIKLPEGVELEASIDPTSSVVYIAAAQKEEAVEVTPTETEEGATAATEGTEAKEEAK